MRRAKVKRAFALPAENFREDQWRDNGGVGFDNEPWCAGAQFAPGDFFVQDRAGVRSEAGGGIADLAEVTPLRHLLGDEILIEQRDDADRKIARDAATDLKEADR